MAEVQEVERQSLIQKLLDSVKQCQATFGDKKNSLATESDSSVACVIVHFEQVLLHGLKRSKVWDKITSISEPFRQVTQKMLPEIEITFWSVLKEYLGPLDVQHFQNLEGITTDAGRCRVWLRTALNENTLENHLHSILGHATLRSQFYEPWALMMNDERASTVPTMARGLGSILFAIDTKGNQLNQPFKSVFIKKHTELDVKTHRRIKSSPLPVMAERWDNDSTTTTKPSNTRRKKKKRKVVEATINDMDDTCTNLLSSYSEHHIGEVKENSELYYSSNPDVSTNSEEQSSRTLLHQQSGDEGEAVNYGDKADIIYGDNEQSHIIYGDNEQSHISYGVNEQSYLSYKELSPVDHIGIDESDINYGDKQQSDNGDKEESHISFGVNEQSYLNYKELSPVDHIGKDESVINYGDKEQSDITYGDKEQSHISYGDKQQSPAGQSVIHYGDKDERLLKLNTYDIYPPQDIIMDDPMSYTLDYDNECISAQLETLKIHTDKQRVSDTSLGEDDTLITENINNMLNTAPSLEVSTETSNIDGDSVNDINSCRNSTDSLSDMVDDYIQNISNELLHTEENNNVFKKSDGVTNDKNEITSNTLDKSLGNEENLYQNISKYLQIIAFDEESSQAASDALALVSASNSDAIFQLPPETDAEPSCSEMEKYIPKFIPLVPENPTDQMTTLGVDDLKKAILATAKKKDEVEEKRRLLQCAFDEQQEELYALRTEHDKMRNEFHEEELNNERKVQRLNQEIDFLKKQLKKYVTSVQLLGKDKGISDDVDEGTQEWDTSYDTESSPLLTTETRTNVDENIFEERLSQMAEMHGELLEFQENLQRQLISKNNEITLMKEQLVSLRGPLPDNTDIVSDSIENSYSPSKMLINIWIPSVFLKTKGTESYHLYQVYVHVGNDEWNIYRRYSQFNKLHSELCKSHPILENLNFPKKKLFGKKDEKLVEKRRLQFQEYLRTVINTLITNKSMLSTDASRRKLIDLLPFFGENFDDESDRRWRGNKKKHTKKTTNSNPRYSGL